MAKPRIELQNLLSKTLGSKNVYFQPPTSVNMNYPCIRYERNKIQTYSANNAHYGLLKQYTLTAIYKDPDSDLPDKIAKLPCCKHVDHYIADNLQHDIFTIYF